MLAVSSFPRTPSLGLRSVVEKMIKSLFTGGKKSNRSCPSWSGNAPFLLGSHTQTLQPAVQTGKQRRLHLFISNYSAEKEFLCR